MKIGRCIGEEVIMVHIKNEFRTPEPRKDAKFASYSSFSESSSDTVTAKCSSDSGYA